VSQNESPVETGKVLGSIYGSLIILFAVFFFLSAIVFEGLTPDAALRSYQLVCIVGGFLVVIGAELGKVLFRSGVTIVGFLGFLALNLSMIVMSLAVFADIIVPTEPVAITYVLIILVASIVWYLIVTLLALRDWRKSR